MGAHGPLMETHGLIHHPRLGEAADNWRRTAWLHAPPGCRAQPVIASGGEAVAGPVEAVSSVEGNWFRSLVGQSIASPAMPERRWPGTCSSTRGTLRICFAGTPRQSLLWPATTWSRTPSGVRVARGRSNSKDRNRRNRILRAPTWRRSRYETLVAVKVLPEPVAI